VDDEEPDWDAIIEGLRQGNPEVVALFYRRYGEQLQAIAERRIGGQLRRRIDASDVVQSAMRTFFRRAHEGRVELGDSEKLWNLLCAITLTKVREQARFHRRNRRDVQRETPASAVDDSGSLPMERVPHHEPTPDVVAEFRDQLQFLMDAMDDEERQVLACKLQNCTNDEAASQIGISERSVRRILSRLKHRLEKQFGEAGE
jgi:RNA polymerase sigma-70 factor (ECF subfamily)